MHEIGTPFANYGLVTHVSTNSMSIVLIESISHNNLLANTAGAGASRKGQVISAIKSASQSSGVDFSYLLNQAKAESSLNPTAKAKTSSATGLYQFVDQTWLRTMKDTGAKHGLGELASKIQVGNDGIARTESYADRAEILALRNDPQVSANMAAELAKSNKRVLARKVGGDVGATELYMAHFLGAGGASNFLNKMKEKPDAVAANSFPAAAKSNKNVFYDRATGKARSVSEIYNTFAQKFGDEPTAASTGRAYASAAQPEAIAHEAYAQSKWQPSVASNFSYSTASSQPSAPNQHAAFTTMLMAQMDMNSFALDSQDYMSKIGNYEENQRRSVYETLSQAA